jgi:hypothetical protein
MTLDGFAFLITEMILTVLFAAGAGFLSGWLVRPLFEDKRDQEWNLRLAGLREDVKSLTGLLNHEREKRERAERQVHELRQEIVSLATESGKAEINRQSAGPIVTTR